MSRILMFVIAMWIRGMLKCSFNFFALTRGVCARNVFRHEMGPQIPRKDLNWKNLGMLILVQFILEQLKFGYFQIQCRSGIC